MVIRETSSARANRIVNSPGVGEYLRPDGAPIDLAPLIEAGGGGCFILSNGDDALTIHDRTAPGVYQCHIAFAPTCRGRRAQATVLAMRDWMYAHGARILWSDIPRWNLPVVRFLSRIGAVWQPSSDADTLIWEMRAAGVPA